MAAGFLVTAAVRDAASAERVPQGCDVRIVGDISVGCDWAKALDQTDVVVHLAARVHVMSDHGFDALAAYRLANVEATNALARAAAAAGVKRLVYVSSVKAVAERTAAPLTEMDPPQPQDAYGQSKREAEVDLAGIAAETGLEVVVIRPPLVYGPGVGGNFRRLLALVRVASLVPLPLGGGGLRSFVYVHNLASALLAAATHPAAAGETFFVRDGRDLTTGDLMRLLGSPIGRTPRLFALPGSVIRRVGQLVGWDAEIDRLLGSLQVSDARLRWALDWTPPFSAEDALAVTARALTSDAADVAKERA